VLSGKAKGFSFVELSGSVSNALGFLASVSKGEVPKESIVVERPSFIELSGTPTGGIFLIIFAGE
jgi:hypothetical protein